MRSPTRRGVPLLVLGVLLALAPGVEAQAPARGQVDRDRLEQRVRARMAQMIRERLDLTAEEGELLGSVMEDFHQRRRELRREEWALRQSVGSWVEEGAGPEGEARELLERMVELRREEIRLFQEEQDRLLEILTPEQVLTFHALRDRLSQRLRELRGGPGGPRGPGGPGGFGPGER